MICVCLCSSYPTPFSILIHCTSACLCTISRFLLLDLPGAGVNGRNPEYYFDDFGLVMLDALVFVIREERLTLPDLFLHVLGKALPRGMPVFLLFTCRDLVMANFKNKFMETNGRMATALDELDVGHNSVEVAKHCDRSVS